ncbi:HAD family hydrolase [Luxibacter massiliensis]|uniref:HAD family hydrolase n=1 Tax=Luxibacter massiliensis TaxID=2219695 RepID=UPI000F060C0E|nr:HAD family hydrolase [Luxibacter massiliensis]
MEIGAVLFDLDGTLTDSGPGIINGVQYALEKFGIASGDPSELKAFVGPPLLSQFQAYCSFSLEESRRAVEYYREYYRETGLYENEVYEGIPELLEALKKAGRKIFMATSKPQEFAEKIAGHFGLARYFDFIGGSLMDGRRVRKSEVIEYVLDSCHMADRGQAIMVGDRDYDIIGAKEAGVRSMGVLYGYGNMEELKKAGADVVVETPREAAEYILGSL